MRNNRTFMAVLGDVRSGAAVAEMSEALADIVQRAIESGKQGSISLTLTVQPHGAGQNGFFIQDTMKVALPKMPKDKTVMFADAEGNLTRRDPRQPDLPMGLAPAVSG